MLKSLFYRAQYFGANFVTGGDVIVTVTADDWLIRIRRRGRR